MLTQANVDLLSSSRVLLSSLLQRANREPAFWSVAAECIATKGFVLGLPKSAKIELLQHLSRAIHRAAVACDVSSSAVCSSMPSTAHTRESDVSTNDNSGNEVTQRKADGVGDGSEDVNADGDRIGGNDGDESGFPIGLVRALDELLYTAAGA
jgi:hypothetical protein